MTTSRVRCWPVICVGIAVVAFLDLSLAAAASAKAAKPPAPAAAQPLQPGTEHLTGILVVPRWEDVNKDGVVGVTNVVVKGPAFLKRRDFEKLLARNLGAALTSDSLRRMQTNIIIFCRKQGYLVVDVIYPEQEVTDGAIQIAVTEGRVGKVTVTNLTRKWFPNSTTNLTHKWFSDSIVLRGVPLKPGEPVVEQKLDYDLNWVNRNTYQDLGYFNGSFRDVTANFKQGEPGKTDVELQAVEQFPLRAYVGIDDAGIATIGTERFFAGFNWANAFGLDQRFSYQYISDLAFENFHENVGSYVIPLPWKNELTLFGAYSTFNPDYGEISPALKNYQNEGYFYQLSARYAIPLPAPLKYSHELIAGFDFKRTDSPLLFTASTAPISTNTIDVAEFMLGYSGRLQDRWGSTAIALQGFYSPGEIGQYNTEAAFNEFYRGSTPQYLYGRAEIQRTTSLPYGFSWYTKAAGQLSDARLVATEAFSLGGWDTVRGYDQNVVSGDNGWLLINELRTKPFKLFGNFHGRMAGADWIQGLVFCDYGGTYFRSPPAQGWPSSEILLSVGVGFRYQLARNFMARFDYGWQLDRNYLNAPAAATLGPQPTSRAHFGLELSF